MVRTEYLFNSAVENVNSYLSRAALAVDSIDNGTKIGGKSLRDVWSIGEIEEFKSYVWRIMQPIIDTTIRYVIRTSHMSELADDFTSEFYTLIWKNFYKYNNQESRNTSYVFSTFINCYIPEARKEAFRLANGYSKRMHDKIRKIEKTKKYIVDSFGVKYDDIKPEDIFMFMSEVSDVPLSLRDIKETIRVTQPKYSIDTMETGEEQMMEVSYSVADPAFTDCIIEFVRSMRPIQQFIFLQNYGFCDVRFSEITIKQMSVNEIFVELCREDKFARKNIKHGDLKIERPRTVEGEKQQMLEITDVDYVSEKFIRNERDRARKNLINMVMNQGYEPEDFEGNISIVLDELWNELVRELGI